MKKTVWSKEMIDKTFGMGHIESIESINEYGALEEYDDAGLDKDESYAIDPGTRVDIIITYVGGNQLRISISEWCIISKLK